MPVAPAGAGRRAGGHGRDGPRPRRRARARGGHRSARRAGAVLRLADDPRRRRGRRPSAGRRAGRSHLPRLSAARRALLARPRPGGAARGPDRSDDEERPVSPAIGETAPPFELPDTEGDRQSLNGDGEAAAATVVVFTCNHCPYALAWHDRLLDVARDYRGHGVRMLLVNSNDAERYPRDSYDAMRARVRDDGGWPAPY